jgi:hypothetical protein
VRSSAASSSRRGASGIECGRNGAGEWKGLEELARMADAGGGGFKG